MARQGGDNKEETVKRGRSEPAARRHRASARRCGASKLSACDLATRAAGGPCRVRALLARRRTRHIKYIWRLPLPLPRYCPRDENGLRQSGFGCVVQCTTNYEVRITNHSCLRAIGGWIHAARETQTTRLSVCASSPYYSSDVTPPAPVEVEVEVEVEVGRVTGRRLLLPAAAGRVGRPSHSTWLRRA
eukprot:scaffold18586_cov59-Phaeocystis_antarctica.AAC.4